MSVVNPCTHCCSTLLMGGRAAQVCSSEADVKRALHAWSDYRTSGKQPIEQYTKSMSAKRTLATLWGQQEIKAAKVGGNEDNVSNGVFAASLQNSGIHAQEDSMPSTAKKANLSEASCLQHPAASILGAKSDFRTATTAGGQASIPASVTVGMAAMMSSQESDKARNAAEKSGSNRAEAENGGSAPNTLHNSRSRREESTGGREESRPDAKARNAFSVLMSRAKPAPVASLQPSAAAAAAAAASQSKAGGQRYRQASWKDALRRVALDPER